MSYSQISKNSVGLSSASGGGQNPMMTQSAMPHHHPYMSPQPHLPQQQQQQQPQQRGATGPGMLLGSMSPGPVSQRMHHQQQQSPYSPSAHSQQHNMYGMSQPSHMTPMMQNNYGGSGPMHSPMHHAPQRHAIIAARSNNTHAHPIVTQHAYYPRSKPSRNFRPVDKAPLKNEGGGGGGGEPTREPLRDVVVLPHPHLANTKEKTPMCLVNELARYNKVTMQYILEDEQGPAHQKVFFMKLKIGEEEYSGTDASIRKAQQRVAAMALEKTELKKPPERNERSGKQAHSKSNDIVPTVELNNLVMQRGDNAVYSPMTPRQQHFKGHPNFNYRGIYNYGRMPVLHYVSLKIGPREFVGFGPTPKAAKNNAANKALRILRHLPMPVKEPPKEGEVVPPPPVPKSENGGVSGELVKSEISLLHEIALKRDLHVSFEMTREVGPAHKKMFTTRCILGDLMCESEAPSKKASKKMAAEKMLARLRQNGPLPVSEVLVPGKNILNNKKKTKNLIKTQKGDTNYGIDINPISRLIQIMQAQKKKEPEYSFLAERGLPRRKEFIMQVTCDGKSCNGVAQNKKLAKRNAAENMLNLLGLNQPSPVPGKPALKQTTTPDLANPADKKVSFVEGGTGGVNADKGDRAGRQLTPGLILLPESNRNASNTPYIKGRMVGIADPSDLGARRLVSGGDGGHVSPGVPAHIKQELTRMANSHNMDISFNAVHSEGGAGVAEPQRVPTLRGNIGTMSERNVAMNIGVHAGERIKPGGPVLGKR